MIWDREDIFLGRLWCGGGEQRLQTDAGGKILPSRMQKDLFGLFFQANSSSSADNVDALLTDLETRRAVQEGKIILQGSVAAGAFRE